VHPTRPVDETRLITSDIQGWTVSAVISALKIDHEDFIPLQDNIDLGDTSRRKETKSRREEILKASVQENSEIEFSRYLHFDNPR